MDNIKVTGVPPARQPNVGAWQLPKRHMHTAQAQPARLPRNGQAIPTRCSCTVSAGGHSAAWVQDLKPETHVLQPPQEDQPHGSGWRQDAALQAALRLTLAPLHGQALCVSFRACLQVQEAAGALPAAVLWPDVQWAGPRQHPCSARAAAECPGLPPPARDAGGVLPGGGARLRGKADGCLRDQFGCVQVSRVLDTLQPPASPDWPRTSVPPGRPEQAHRQGGSQLPPAPRLPGSQGVSGLRQSVEGRGSSPSCARVQPVTGCPSPPGWWQSSRIPCASAHSASDAEHAVVLLPPGSIPDARRVRCTWSLQGAAVWAMRGGRVPAGS